MRIWSITLWVVLNSEEVKERTVITFIRLSDCLCERGDKGERERKRHVMNLARIDR
jgi:hypothetical protein